MPRRRRNRVTERIALVIAAAAGTAAAFAPPSPTGRPIVDHVLVAAGVFAVTYAGASAPSWLVVVVPVAAVAAAVEPPLIAVGVVALVAGVAVAARRRSMSTWRAVAIGGAMNVLAWAALDGFFGLTSIVGIAAGVLVWVVSVRRRPRQVRRRTSIAAAVLIGAGVLTLVGFGAGAVGAQRLVDDARDRIETGITMLNAGDFAGAADEFASAATALDDAHDRFANPLAAGAGFVPVVAQHRAFAVELSEQGAALSSQVADALRGVEFETLVSPGGRIDVARLAALQQPFADIEAALDDLDAVIAASSESPWILDDFRRQLARLSAVIGENRPQLEQLGEAVELLPAMLGADGERRYLVLFTTPAEARGLGGMPGSYAELAIVDGQIAMTDFGRAAEYDVEATGNARITRPPGFLNRWGAFGWNQDGNGLIGNGALRDVTMTPHFPWAAEVVAEVYPQVTGRELDGVIVMDPFVVAQLIEYSGPIELTTQPVTLTADNAVQYLLHDQYLEVSDLQSNEERIDALEEAGQLMFETLLEGTLPDPTALAHGLGPLVGERRLLMWTTADAEQDFLREVGLLGEIPVARGANGWSVIVNNQGFNKIDSYLERRASYASTVDPATGEVTGTLRVTLTNTAPTSGLPNYVIGSAFDLPLGTSRLYVSFYSPLLLISGTRDGEPVFLAGAQEQGWNVYSQFVTIPSGQTVSFGLEFRGQASDPDTIVTWTQPLAQPLLPLE